MLRSDAVNPTGEPLRGDEPDPAEIRTARAVENFLRKRLREFAAQCIVPFLKNAGWSSLVARQAHNLKVAGSNPAPASTSLKVRRGMGLCHPKHPFRKGPDRDRSTVDRKCRENRLPAFLG